MCGGKFIPGSLRACKSASGGVCPPAESRAYTAGFDFAGDPDDDPGVHEREVARILGEEEREPVYLHPYLQIRRGEVLLEARIGREKRYIVKNLLEFAQAVHSGKRVEYGKGMAFEHVPSAFAPESRHF